MPNLLSLTSGTSLYRKFLGERSLTAIGLKRFQTLENTGITFLNLTLDISLYREFIDYRGLKALEFTMFQSMRSG